jgi:threonine dehydratase
MRDSMLKPPVFRDVLRARKIVSCHVPRTLFRRYAELDERIGAEVFIKHENHNPTGAFKVRGGINLISQLRPAERERGVIAASTGNHGQSVAYAGRLFGVTVRIGVPEGANPEKVAAMRAVGAEVFHHGKDFDQARVQVEALAAEHGYRYIHSANEPMLIAGVGTYALEMYEDEPDLDVIIVPIGGGSSACGCCLVAKTLAPNTRVIGVQSEQAPASYRAWKYGTMDSVVSQTSAEGPATGTPFELTQSIMREHLDDFILVSDDQIDAAIRLMLEAAGTRAEGAGAASLAGALVLAPELRGKKVALVVTGGNLSKTRLQQLFISRC